MEGTVVTILFTIVNKIVAMEIAGGPGVRSLGENPRGYHRQCAGLEQPLQSQDDAGVTQFDSLRVEGNDLGRQSGRLAKGQQALRLQRLQITGPVGHFPSAVGGEELDMGRKGDDGLSSSPEGTVGPAHFHLIISRPGAEIVLVESRLPFSKGNEGVRFTIQMMIYRMSGLDAGIQGPSHTT